MRKDKFFWIAVVLVFVGAGIATYTYIQRASLIEDRINQLSRLQEQQLSLFIERVSALLTVATLIVGGAGALLLHFWELGRLSVAQQRWAAVSLLAAGVSVYFGYVAYDSAIWMLRAEFFNLETEAVRIPSFLQLFSSGLGILFLVLSFLAGPVGGRRGEPMKTGKEMKRGKPTSNPSLPITWSVAALSLIACSCGDIQSDRTDHAPMATVITFRQGVMTWEAATKISVSEPAAEAMEKDWIRLTEDRPRKEIKPDLARAYLYEIRDARGLTYKQPAVVSLEDVQTLPLQRYAVTASFGRDVGFLRCVSTPEGGVITIDGEKRGSTTKEFTLAVGTYKIGIELQKKQCVKTIQIEAYDSAEFTCVQEASSTR